MEQVYFHYDMLLLNKQNYTQPMYSIYMNPVIVHHLNIEPKTMGFFQKEDNHKTILIICLVELETILCIVDL